jgi:hypothetical protein
VRSPTRETLATSPSGYSDKSACEEGASGNVDGLVVVFVVLGVRRLALGLALAVVLHGRPSWEIE